MIGGSQGKILHVNLSTGETFTERPADDIYRLLIGGRAMVAYLLLRDMPAGSDPLGPDNLLIFAPGIFQGTNLPGSGRHGVGGKSPLTGAIASSEAGGWWGHEFKRSGFDALVIRGQAESPVYLWIKDGEVEIRPAGHLWGQKTSPVEEAIRQELGDERIRVAQIGPAGENLVLYSAVMHDVNRAAGRNGLGALMGSKKLKAVAVRGTLKVRVAERKPVAGVAKWLGDNYRELSGWATEGIGRGTQDGLTGLARTGGLPTHNFSEPVFSSPELLSGERNYEMFLKGRDTCQSCPINCKQIFEYDDENPYRKLDPAYGGPEYESMAAFGPLCGVTDNVAVSKANELANSLGMDTISAGASIAFVMACFEAGLLTAEDTGGLEYRWGDADLMVRSVEMIARREGFGDVLAEGVDRMSQRFGPATQPFNLTVKGQELPMHEPRLKHAMGLGYAVAPVGADHMMNMHDTAFTSDGEGLRRVNSALPEDAQIKPLSNTLLNEEKLRLFTVHVNWMHFQDCAVSCHFYPYQLEHMAQALSGITGIRYSLHDILDIGARAQTLSRLFNQREGLTVDDDQLPKGVRKAFQAGPLAGIEITDEALSWAKGRYYELMGWDGETAEPGEACLKALQLDELLKSGPVPEFE
jgi:aldehyde:ferredoxin oxidoreductase